MKKLIIAVLSVCVLNIVASSCRRSADVAPDRILRFDLAAPSFAELDSEARIAFLDTFRPVADLMASIASRGAIREADDTFLVRYAGDLKMRYYLPGIVGRLGSLDSVERSLGIARDNAALLLPELRWPRIYGAVITYNQSVVVADSILLLGLNHYLGPDYEPYAYFADYQRYGKQKRFIPYHLVEALVSLAYPYRPSADATALSRMAYEGALTEAVMELLDSSDESTALGYDPEQMAWARGNEAEAWKAMIDRGAVYSTDSSVADRLVRPAPNTSVVHPSAPGRFGRFIGHRIVRSYLKHNPGVSLSTMLDSAFYNSPDLLVASGYSPV